MKLRKQPIHKMKSKGTKFSGISFRKEAQNSHSENYKPLLKIKDPSDCTTHHLQWTGRVSIVQTTILQN
jgi:hypothetical protein